MNNEQFKELINDTLQYYDTELFPPPDMDEVRELLGDMLCSRVSAHVARFALNGLLWKLEQMNTPEPQASVEGALQLLSGGKQ